MSALEPVLARVRRFGPLRFSEFQDIALYGEGGFFASGRGAGRAAGDFLTSPEVGPLFGAVVARALDAWWLGLGSPDPFVVIEAAAGRGQLCRDVLAAAPACAPALRYLLVEASAALRDEQGALVRLEPARYVLGPIHEDDEEGPIGERGIGPLCASLGELPTGPLTGVVLANELLDNLPVDLFVRTEDGWDEVRVGEQDGALVEVLVPAPDPGVGDVPPGARIPVQRAARRWVADARRVLRRGRVVCFDYADSTAGLASRPMDEWLRTYRGHARGAGVLERVGEQDITCEVAVDQLAPAIDRSQAEWLGAHGLGGLVDDARAAWEAGAAAPSLAVLAARSRMSEAAALTDPAGLGAFRVLEWEV